MIFHSYGLRELNGKRYISDKVPGSIIVSTSADGLWGKRSLNINIFRARTSFNI